LNDLLQLAFRSWGKTQKRKTLTKTTKIGLHHIFVQEVKLGGSLLLWKERKKGR
jgi:hypothetical protein